MVDPIRSGVQVLIGMDEGDYSGLLEGIRKTKKTEWTCHENTQVGDTVFIYFGEKIGELVACGKALNSESVRDGMLEVLLRHIGLYEALREKAAG